MSFSNPQNDINPELLMDAGSLALEDIWLSSTQQAERRKNAKNQQTFAQPSTHSMLSHNRKLLIINNINIH